MPGGGAPILETEALAKRFGGVVALADYTIRLGRDDLVGLIGPNGAGKTTAFDLLSGVLRPSAGRMRADGVDVTGHRLAGGEAPRRFRRAWRHRVDPERADPRSCARSARLVCGWRSGATLDLSSAGKCA